MEKIGSVPFSARVRADYQILTKQKWREINFQICKDYVTEKYWERIHFASVPIVWKRSIMEAT